MSSSAFIQFAAAVYARFNTLSASELYKVNVERDELFEAYLAAFPEGTNPIFRVRTEHDGNYDRQFIRQVGFLVALNASGKYETLWDIPNLPAPYDVVAAALHKIVLSRAIVSTWRTVERSFSRESNVELKEGQTITFHHFHAKTANRHLTAMPDAVVGAVRTSIGVFRRGMEEITDAAIETVSDLIEANSIYRGLEHREALKAFADLKKRYGEAADKETFLWQNIEGRSADRLNPVAVYRNTVLGTLLVDISEGVDINKAVGSFEAKVAPENYKRTSAVISPKMVEQALETLKELGLEQAVERRHATVSDINVKDIIFVDNSVRGKMKGGSLSDLLMSSVKEKVVDKKKAIEISVDDFLKTVVPGAKSMGLLIEGKHLGNFMSLTAPVHEDSGKLFKWTNDFAWSYSGDVTDAIRERVKAAGGNVDAPLRVSLNWHCADDLDLHAHCPDGQVYYGNKLGILDVDMNGLDKSDHVNPVENLSWRKPKDGKYSVFVRQFNRRNGDAEKFGFDVQIFCNGETRVFRYPKMVSGDIGLFEFTVKGGAVTALKIDSRLEGDTVTSVDKWGIKTNAIVPIDTLLASPNYWNGQAIGNKHWFFILKDAKNPDPVRGIYNEFLRSDMEQHRKVFEVLGSKTKAPFSEYQMSGVGFSSTRKDEAFVAVDTDKTSKVYQIKF